MWGGVQGVVCGVMGSGNWKKRPPRLALFIQEHQCEVRCYRLNPGYHGREAIRRWAVAIEAIEEATSLMSTDQSQRSADDDKGAFEERASLQSPSFQAYKLLSEQRHTAEECWEKLRLSRSPPCILLSLTSLIDRSSRNAQGYVIESIAVSSDG